MTTRPSHKDELFALLSDGAPHHMRGTRGAALAA